MAHQGAYSLLGAIAHATTEEIQQPALGAALNPSSEIPALCRGDEQPELGGLVVTQDLTKQIKRPNNSIA
jgi:hypothetical protein